MKKLWKAIQKIAKAILYAEVNEYDTIGMTKEEIQIAKEIGNYGKDAR